VGDRAQPRDANGVAAPERSGHLDPARWRGTIRLTVTESSRRATASTLASVGLACLAFCGVLVAVAYPAWRVLAFACVAVAYTGPIASSRLRHRAWPRWALDERIALVALLPAAVLTGGIYSPVVAAALGPVNHMAQLRGPARPTFLTVGALSLGLLGVGLLPRAWVGPRVPDPFFAAGVLLFLVPLLLVEARRSRIATRLLGAMIQEVDRAREQVAAQALARARELELLSSKLTHELKNPLGAAKALVQLSARATPDAETRAQLSVAEGEIARIQAVLHEYLSFSRPISQLERRPVQLGPVVDEAIAAVRRRAEEAGVVLDRHGDASASADRRRLTEALLHLLANAIEATPARGQIRVTIAERADRIEIAVRDTGAGMPPDVLARVGTPFFTTRGQRAGLGVLLARNVFVQHGGSLVFESAPGRGTEAVGALPPLGVAAGGAGAVGG
jgi:signal transduction histidine kinase